MTVISLASRARITVTPDNPGIANGLLQAEKSAIDNLKLLVMGSVYPVELVLPGAPAFTIHGAVKQELLSRIEPRPFAEKVRDQIARPAFIYLLDRADRDNLERTVEVDRRPIKAGRMITDLGRHYGRDRDEFNLIEPRTINKLKNIYRAPFEEKLRNELHACALGLVSRNFQEPLVIDKAPLAPVEAVYARLILGKMATDLFDATDWLHHGCAEEALRQREVWAKQVRENSLCAAYNKQHNYLALV